MIVLKKSHQNLSEFIQFLSKKKICERSSEKMRDSGNYIYDYVLVVRRGSLIQCAMLVHNDNYILIEGKICKYAHY